MSTPLTVTGTPEELDRKLPRTLTECVETHQRLSTTLAQVKAEMEAAQEEAKHKSSAE